MRGRGRAVKHRPLAADGIVVKLKLWEIVVAVLGLAFAAIFLVSNTSGLGVGLLAADCLWVVTRVEVAEAHDQAGHYAAARGRLGLLRVALVFLILVAAVYGLFVIRHDLRPNARVAVIANFGIVGFAFMLLGELRRSLDDALNWVTGARAERAVGADLDRLRHQGWLVVHGYKKDRGGDIDHILCGPNGAYIVETKSYGYRARDIRQTAINAWWIREKLGVRWVTGVLCVRESRPPVIKGKIWVVSHDDVIKWLGTRHDGPVEPDDVRRKLL